MIQLVGKYRVAASDQCLYRAEVGEVTGGKQQGGRLTHKCREFIFELLMYIEVTTHQMRSAAAHAMLFCASLQGGN